MEKVLYIEGYITQQTASDLQFILDSKDYLQLSQIDSFHLKFNCQGGDLSATQTIVNLFKDAGFVVKSTIVGFWQSAAPILGMAISNFVACYDNASIMLHNLSLNGRLNGEQISELKATLDQYSIQENWAIDVVAKKTYAKVDQSKVTWDSHRKAIVTKFFNGSDVYVTPSEALAWGLVDQIKSSGTQGVTQMNGMQLNSLMSANIASLNTKKNDTIKSFNKKIKSFMKNIIPLNPSELPKVETEMVKTEVAKAEMAKAEMANEVLQPQKQPKPQISAGKSENEIRLEMVVKTLIADKERLKADLLEKEATINSAMIAKAQMTSQFEKQIQEIGGGREVLNSENTTLKQEIEVLKSKMEVTAQNFDMKLGLSTILDKGKYPLTDEQVGGIINAFRTQNTLIKSQNSNGFEIKGINNESFYSGSLKDAVVKFAYENNHVSHAPKGVMIGSSMDALPAFQAEKLEAEHLKIMMSLGEGHGSKWDVENRMKKGLSFSTTMAKAYGLLK